MNIRPNVIFLLHLPPPVHGSSVIGQLIKNSSRVNETFQCQYINLLASRHVSESGKIEIGKIIRFVGVWFQLLLKILTMRPDICYFALTSTGAAFYKDLLLVVLLKTFRIKIIYHMHNKGVSRYQTKKIHNLLYLFVFYNADVILLSNYLYYDVKEFVKISRVHICPYGVTDITTKKDKLSVESQLPTTILYLSNLIESKGVFILLEACFVLKKKNISFKCVFVGSEGDVNASQFYKKVSQLNLSNQVEFIGRIIGIERDKILQEVDIFALPTYYENECLPLVLLEAMSACLPIVSTFEGGIRDEVEEGVTGFLVPQKSVELLADKLELLIRNPQLREQMGRAGRKKYEAQFTLEHFEKNFVAILQNLTA